MFNPFRIFFPKKMVGVDIGTSSIKIVEISRFGQGKTLENYGEIKSAFFYKELMDANQKGRSLLSNDFIAKTLRGVLDEANIKTKSAIFSIPDFSTFCTSFDIPQMTEKEIPGAIRFNASQYITLPISEVTLDWLVEPSIKRDKTKPIKVFLVAVPNQVIQSYREIARLAGLKLYALEAEALGVARALVKSSQKSICMIDIGAQSSTINIIERGFLRKSYSFNFNSGQLSRSVAQVLGVDLAQAQEVINKEGLMFKRQDVTKALYLLIDPVLADIKNICAEFLQSEKKPIEEIYLTGGTANLPGLKEYFAESLKISILVPNCFSDFLYPPILEETLKDMSPSFSASIGVALGGLET